MRRKPKTRETSTARKIRKAIDKPDETPLQDRISSLEARIERIEEQLTNQGILFRSPFSQDEKKPGPRQRIADELLIELRDGLIQWLERVWPELDAALRKARALQQVQECLLQFADREDHRPQCQTRLLNNAAALMEYRASKKFVPVPPKQTVVTALTGEWTKPEWRRAAARFPSRRMASAMAGVPELDWRTSYDRCSKFPSEIPVGSRTGEHYRRRYRMPACYVLEAEASKNLHWEPVAGPLYSRQQARKVISNRRREPGKRHCIKSEDRLQELGLDPDEEFMALTGLPVLPQSYRKPVPKSLHTESDHPASSSHRRRRKY